MMVSITIDEVEYGIDITYYDPGEEPSHDDPGSGAEVELGELVEVWGHNGNNFFVEKKIPMEEFLKIYADFEDVDVERAAGRLEEFCLQDLAEQGQDHYDDSDV